MTITDFHKTKQGRIALYVDGDFAFSMDPEVFAQWKLTIGQELSLERMEELFSQAQVKAAKEKALQLLSYKEYTAQELERRLRRQLQPEACALAVERMVELGLVNDEDYALRRARDLSRRKLYGPARIRQELRRLGLDRELVEQAISLLEEDDQEKIRSILAKKYPDALYDEKARRRAFSGLMRMGYQADQVRRALDCLEEGYED